MPAPPSSTLWIYLPYVDDQATGMQRFASQMILALGRAGVDFQLLIGEVHGSPPWLDGLPHRRIFTSAVARRLPRFAVALARVLWLQFVFPLIAGRAKGGMLPGRAKGAMLLSLAGELAPFPRVPQIGVAHDLTDFRAYSGRKGLGTTVRNRLWAAGLRRARAVIAISNATREDVLAVFGLSADRVHVVFEGFDPRIFRPASSSVAASEPAPEPASAPYLLYAGTLDPHKNIALALDVFARLRARGRAVTFKLVGRHDKARIAALIDAVPPAVRDGVDFVGFVSDDELARLMRGCAAFVFPSRNEGFGLAPVEAMACGAPVAAAAAGSLPEVVGDGGMLLDPDDADGWVRHVDRLLDDPDCRRDWSARALARSNVFSWDQAAAAYRAIIADPDRRVSQTA